MTIAKQEKVYGPKTYQEAGQTFRIKAVVRHDDECRNGHNMFSITGEIDHKRRNGTWVDHAGGCIHDEIAKHFPELSPFIKWHLCSTDGPLHYIANTTYHASDKDYRGEDKAPNIEYARSAAIWPDATLDQLRDKAALTARLPGLIADFRKAVEALGLKWDE